MKKRVMYSKEEDNLILSMINHYVKNGDSLGRCFISIQKMIFLKYGINRTVTSLKNRYQKLK